MEKYRTTSRLDKLRRRAYSTGAIGATALTTFLITACGAKQKVTSEHKPLPISSKPKPIMTAYQKWQKGVEKGNQVTRATATSHGYRATYRAGDMSVYFPKSSNAKPGAEASVFCFYNQPEDTPADQLISVNYYDDFKAPKHIPGKVNLQSANCTPGFDTIELTITPASGNEVLPIVADFSSMHPR